MLFKTQECMLSSWAFKLKKRKLCETVDKTILKMIDKFMLEKHINWKYKETLITKSGVIDPSVPS